MDAASFAAVHPSEKRFFLAHTRSHTACKHRYPRTGERAVTMVGPSLLYWHGMIQ